MNIDNKATIIIATLVVIGIIATIIVLTSPGNTDSCGASICSEFNQEYHSWDRNTLECTFSYAQFGYPEVSEIFRFEVNDTAKERFCS